LVALCTFPTPQSFHTLQYTRFLISLVNAAVNMLLASGKNQVKQVEHEVRWMAKLTHGFSLCVENRPFFKSRKCLSRGSFISVESPVSIPSYLRPSVIDCFVCCGNAQLRSTPRRRLLARADRLSTAHWRCRSCSSVRTIPTAILFNKFIESDCSTRRRRFQQATTIEEFCSTNSTLPLQMRCLDSEYSKAKVSRCVLSSTFGLTGGV
jgi:hypothetical protein